VESIRLPSSTAVSGNVPSGGLVPTQPAFPDAGRYSWTNSTTASVPGKSRTSAGGAELLFQVLTEREEKNSIAIASNESFSGWTKTFTDPRLCAAIVDRLTFDGTIIETGTDSYRLAHTIAQQNA
jgi:hypothetical protein